MAKVNCAERHFQEIANNTSIPNAQPIPSGICAILRCATLSNPADGDMNEKIQSVLNSLPHKPGIYLMKDAQGTILYVGKANSLYNRVRSYFQESSALSPKTEVWWQRLTILNMSSSRTRLRPWY